jgi:hypothetical protein
MNSQKDYYSIKNEKLEPKKSLMEMKMLSVKM